MSDEQTNLAQVKDLSVSFMTDAGSIKAIDKISFTIPRKTVVGVVGESGSGKSVTARSIIKLLPETATTSGAIYLSNREGNEQLDVLSLSGEDLRRMRGSEAAMVFQEPNSVLNPVYTIGWQIEEGLRAHGMKDKKELRAKSVDILKKVGIPDAETRIDYYPHQFSGGQKQRIVIAMALVLNPGLILADEPTTALDVTVQAEILDLLRLARDEFGASVLIITHNMGVIADIADEVVVMYRGHVVEQGSVEQIFYSPKDDYTKLEHIHLAAHIAQAAKRQHGDARREQIHRAHELNAVETHPQLLLHHWERHRHDARIQTRHKGHDEHGEQNRPFILTVGVAL